MAKGEAFLTEDGKGAITWALPDNVFQPFSMVLRGGPNMVRAGGLRHTPTMLSALNMLESRHKTHEEPPWYLPFIGVAPSHQGKGYGGALLSHKLESLDEEGRPAYLEASTERNRALYARKRQLFVDVFARRRVVLDGSAATMYLWVVVPEGETSESFADRLLDHGVAVERVAPVAASLEDRFLTMTTRLEDRS